MRISFGLGELLNNTYRKREYHLAKVNYCVAPGCKVGSKTTTNKNKKSNTDNENTVSVFHFPDKTRSPNGEEYGWQASREKVSRLVVIPCYAGHTFLRRISSLIVTNFARKLDKHQNEIKSVQLRFQ